MEGVQSISISDLLRRRRPISGAVSLLHFQPSVTSPEPSGDSKTQNPNSSHTKVLKSFSEPSMIVGIISLPIFNDSLSSNSTFPHFCFSFSDGCFSICCDVIDFDIRMIRRKINVLAWNFIPFKQCGGLLEIIKWKFHEGSISGNVNYIPLVLEDNDFEKDSDKKTKYSVYGVLGSVSPVSFVPCSNESVSKNIRGFVIEIFSCECSLCKSINLVKGSENLVLGRNAHCFCRTNHVCFCGISSSWYPMFLRLTGSVLLLSGLKKKLVYIGKEETQLMFVSTELTCLHVPNLQQKEDCLLQNGIARIKGKGELGVYIGVVRGIYMQGLVVELDQEVWLLLTDESLILPHSVRVGSIIRVRNVHVLNPRFQWGKMLILGACCKSNINTISFSPLETGCHLKSWSKSLLGKFMESLVFQARLWVLLLVQCLRKKLSGAFSEKEILGTRHKEGLVQTYAKFILTSSVLQSRHGIFMEFCKHDSCGSGSNNYYGSLSLAMPFSNLVNHCERMCLKSLLQMDDGLKILGGCGQIGHLFQENILSDQPIRRILQSKDIGVSLLGNLKICPATGRLQYIDATGCIDAVIPDIPSTWNMNAIYEVFNYSLVLEGMLEMWGRLLDGDLFSCGRLFQTNAIERQTELTVYVHFSWSNVCCRHFALHPCPSSINSSAKLDPGTFHLLCLAHKFPLQPKFHGDLLLSGNSRLFAEVMVLPWDLNIAMHDGATLLTKMTQALENGCQNGFALKRCKTYQTSSSFSKVGLCSSFEESGRRLCDQPSDFLSLPHKRRSLDNSSSVCSVQIPCTLNVREIHGQIMAVPAILCFTDSNHNMLCSRSSRKLLLEFNSENFFKYKLLQIGGFYIMKHSSEKCFCDSHDINSGNSMSVTSDTKFWSLSFHFGEAIDGKSGSCNNPSSASRPTSEYLNRFYLQNELVINPCSSGTFYDVDLHVAADATGLLDVYKDFLDLNKPVINLSLRSTDIRSVGQQVVSGNSVMGFPEIQGMYFGNAPSVGNLISLQGTVVSLHNSDSCSIGRITCNGAAHNVHPPSFNRDKEGSMYLLLLADDHLVQIYGCSKLDCPVGLGPGAVVTFHRILAFSGQNCLMLTPISFITMNSVREIRLPTVKSLCPIHEDTITSCFISDLIHNDTCQPRRFRCSIVAVYFVMFERDKNMDKLLSGNSGTSVVKIPLAGFILDDGSSHCCCWTNGERAATFLRLHEEIPQSRSGSRWWISRGSVSGRAFSTPSYQLGKILKKHGRLSVKNYGSIYDALCQDLHPSVGSDYTFDSQDENLLKFIMFNACSSTFWNVVGNAIDFDAVNMLEKNLLEEQMTMPALQNVWAREVWQVNPLAQAKALSQDL